MQIETDYDLDEYGTNEKNQMIKQLECQVMKKNNKFQIGINNSLQFCKELIDQLKSQLSFINEDPIKKVLEKVVYEQFADNSAKLFTSLKTIFENLKFYYTNFEKELEQSFETKKGRKSFEQINDNENQQQQEKTYLEKIKQLTQEKKILEYSLNINEMEAKSHIKEIDNLNNNLLQNKFIIHKLKNMIQKKQRQLDEVEIFLSEKEMYDEMLIRYKQLDSQLQCLELATEKQNMIIHQLEHENSELMTDNHMQCKICYCKLITSVLPCGHCFCSQCIKLISEKNSIVCSFCKQPTSISQIKKIYI